MASRKKKDAPAEEHLETPAAEIAATPEDNAIPDRSADWQWPESTEFRTLPVPWNDRDRSKAATEFASLRGQYNDTKDRKKSAASAFQATIDGLDEEMNRLADRIDADGEDRKVRCTWAFECSGVDTTTGERIRHPEMKALFRDDTGEMVCCCAITAEERQASFNLGTDEPTAEECDATLIAAGYELGTRETPGEDETPFYLESIADGELCDVDGDDRLTALRNAVRTVHDDLEAAADVDPIVLRN